MDITGSIIAYISSWNGYKICDRGDDAGTNNPFVAEILERLTVS